MIGSCARRKTSRNRRVQTHCLLPGGSAWVTTPMGTVAEPLGPKKGPWPRVQRSSRVRFGQWFLFERQQPDAFSINPKHAVVRSSCRSETMLRNERFGCETSEKSKRSASPGRARRPEGGRAIHSHMVGYNTCTRTSRRILSPSETLA